MRLTYPRAFGIALLSGLLTWGFYEVLLYYFERHPEFGPELIERELLFAVLGAACFAISFGMTLTWTILSLHKQRERERHLASR